MNTQYIRKQAIALKLGELLTGTCKYSPKTPARWGVIEPNVESLEVFQNEIATLARLHFLDALKSDDVQAVIGFCERVARPIGHLMSDGCTTGTWGVRLHELNEIIEVIKLEDFELLPFGTETVTYGIPVKILDYTVTEDWLVVKYEQQGEYEGTFEDCVSWKNINNLKK